MKNHLLLLIILTVLLIPSCNMDPNLYSGPQTTWEDSACWMGNIDSQVLLRKIVIPGTHDSCANYDFLSLSSTAGTQDLDLMQQLEAGARSLDIRACLQGGRMLIKHGPVSQHMTLDNVFDTVSSFLSSNPTETVVLCISAEDRDMHDETNIENWIDDNGADYPIICDANLGNITLGSCRGKILLIVEYDYCTGYRENSPFYEVDNIESHWSGITSRLSSAQSNRLEAIYCSGYFIGQFGIPNIRIVSSVINPKLEEYLTSTGISKGCIIAVNHITANLANSIYMCNF